MTDIVERLRKIVINGDDSLVLEAADEIERLRALCTAEYVRGKADGEEEVFSKLQRLVAETP